MTLICVLWLYTSHTHHQNETDLAAGYAGGWVAHLQTSKESLLRTLRLGSSDEADADIKADANLEADQDQVAIPTQEVAKFVVPSKNRYQKWPYRLETEHRIRELAVCLASGDCPPNRAKVAIMAALPCYMTLYHDYNGGEGIWCTAMMRSLERQGYTVLYAREDWEYVEHIHRQMPDMVKIILGDDMDKAKKYLKTSSNQGGIPAWKIMFMWYFPIIGRSPVGNEWHISAEPAPAHWNATYIGYDVNCDGNPVPFESRPNQIYVMAKRLLYFYASDQAWPVSFFARATEELGKEFEGFEFVAGYRDEDAQTKSQHANGLPHPEGVRNLGRLSPEDFAERVRESKALLGIGSPPQSPSPYTALCEGVPFINPVRLHDPAKGIESKSNFKHAQHWSISGLSAPYNYPVIYGDYESFVGAIRAALSTPTPGYVLDRMKSDALDDRMKAIMDRDWYGMASAIQDRRSRGEDSSGSSGKTFTL